jgi:predicted N-formylglutamate amidohydrolase
LASDIMHCNRRHNKRGDGLRVGDNEAHAPIDGVYHSIGKHGEANGLPCMMLEIRNDVMAASQSQADRAGRSARALESALASINRLILAIPTPHFSYNKQEFTHD